MVVFHRLLFLAAKVFSGYDSLGGYGRYVVIRSISSEASATTREGSMAPGQIESLHAAEIGKFRDLIRKQAGGQGCRSVLVEISC